MLTTSNRTTMLHACWHCIAVVSFCAHSSIGGLVIVQGAAGIYLDWVCVSRYNEPQRFVYIPINSPYTPTVTHVVTGAYF